MRDDEIKAREANLEFLHVGVKTLMQFRAFACCVIQILRIESIIIRAQSSGERLDAAREYSLADARHPKLETLLNELLKRRW